MRLTKRERMFYAFPRIIDGNIVFIPNGFLSLLRRHTYYDRLCRTHRVMEMFELDVLKLYKFFEGMGDRSPLKYLEPVHIGGAVFTRPFVIIKEGFKIMLDSGEYSLIDPDNCNTNVFENIVTSTGRCKNDTY